MSVDKHAQGRASNRAGQGWQRQAAAWLRETGIYPYAMHVGTGAPFKGHGDKGDLQGVGDIAVECTVSPWVLIAAHNPTAKEPSKLIQAERAATRLAVPSFCVWKPVDRGRDGRSVVVTRADVFWRERRELEDLRLREGTAEDAYDRGYAAGRRAALAEANGGRP